MKTHQVFEHPTLGREAVKVGWSWPGFFFTWVWAFVKGLWLHGVLALALSVILAVIHGPLYFVGMAALSLIMGGAGNGFLSTRLEHRGYRRVGQVFSRTPQGALAEIHR